MAQNVCLVLLCLATAALPTSSVLITEQAQTFSSAAKGGSLDPNEENTVYESGNLSTPGYITQQWFTSFPSGSRVRIYIDGEVNASIDADLLMLIGVGNCSGQSAQSLNIPWGNRRFGHLARGGGIYTNIRIPFSTSVRVTVESTVPGVYWYIIRLVMGSPLQVNGYEFPPNTRLKLYNIDNQLYQPYDIVPGANVQGKAGWLYMVAVSANSSNYHFLEACFRLQVDGERMQFLSSGTEDMFLSAFYFSAGTYAHDSAGLTCFDGVGVMSAYKMFEDDPILFKKSMQIMWRCGEKQGEEAGCPNIFQPINGTVLQGDPIPQAMIASMYTWVYEYDL